jgi:NADPH:quinone reductase-like Zn-dependent oxidoreductase
VGIVDRVGNGVSSVEPGQIVAAGTWVLGVGGGYAEHVCLPERELVPVPVGIDPAEAVCLVVDHLTAHQYL